VKKNYNRSISLRCVVCGSADHFEYNADKTYVKCTLCNREYLGGQEELQEMSEALIAEEVDILKEEVSRDVEKDLTDMFKQVLHGNKFIKFE
jgi:hypothetical protein